MNVTPHAAWLIDERWEKAYPIEDMVSIGRGPENVVILRDPAVSRLHATVTGEEDAYVLRTFGMSGTTVNGTAAGGECVLHEGDRIEIASSTLRFSREAPADDAIVLRRDNPVSLDRLAASTRAFPVRHGKVQRPRRTPARAFTALAFLLGSLLILLSLR